MAFTVSWLAQAVANSEACSKCAIWLEWHKLTWSQCPSTICLVCNTSCMVNACMFKWVHLCVECMAMRVKSHACKKQPHAWGKGALWRESSLQPTHTHMHVHSAQHVINVSKFSKLTGTMLVTHYHPNLLEEDLANPRLSTLRGDNTPAHSCWQCNCSILKNKQSERMNSQLVTSPCPSMSRQGCLK